MHFALPPRKDAKVPMYVAARNPTRRYHLRRGRLRQLFVGLGLFLLLMIVVRWIRSGGSNQKPTRPWKDLYELEDGSVVERNLPAGTPRVVIITPVDPQYGPTYKEMISTNRRRYAALHGYEVFMPNLFDYDKYIPGLIRTWSRIPCVRDTLNRFPHTPWFLFLDQHALIMNTSIPISSINSASQLREHLRPGIPIVPPDSVVKTLDQREEVHRIDLILTQDSKGISSSSFLLRRGEWAKFFLDSWFDPLYRSYDFERAETQALEHMLQWHKTILSQAAIVPQRLMNAYWSSASSTSSSGTSTPAEQQASLYHDGDFIAVAHDCEKDVPNSCSDQIAALYARWSQTEDKQSS